MSRSFAPAAATGALLAAAVAALAAAAPGQARYDPPVRDSVAPSTYVAYARGRSVAIYPTERSRVPRRVLASPTYDGTLLSFLVRSLHVKRALVYLPARPNGSSGWIERSQVGIYANPYRVRIDLRAHRLTAWSASRVLVRASVGVGRAVTPTPAGTYYIVSRVRPIQLNSVYGAFAFGLSAHSNVFERFGFGGDGRIGLHGTNDPAGVGHDVSHGCIRMTNRSILRLSRLLPLGTPVVITHS